MSDTLTNRHRLVALMDLEGAPPARISETTGYTTTRVVQLRRSPMYQAYLKDLRTRLEAKRIDSIADMLRATVQPSVVRLEKLRDNAFGDVPYNVQHASAAKLLDSAISTEKRVEQDHHVKPNIVLSGEAAARIASMLIEAGVQLGAPKNVTTLDEGIATADVSTYVADSVLAEQ